MALRSIEVVAPRSDKGTVLDSLGGHASSGEYTYWVYPVEDETDVCIRIVLDVKDSENVLDKLATLFTWTENYRIIVYPVEATLPRLEGASAKEPEAEAPRDDPAGSKSVNRISREELYADILDMAQLNRIFVVLTVCATLVAIIGLWRDNVAVIIGAMVLAPLLGPNVGLSLATTLGDIDLGKRSLATLAVSVCLVLGISLAAGLLFGLPERSEELAARAVIDYPDVLLALVAGAAGIISVTLGGALALVGVMVALALLPPLTACGLYAGAGDGASAVGAAMLFVANLIGLNLSGVVTFLAQGIRPINWWERERARALTVRMVLLWAILLVFLLALIAFGVMR
ncbi:TIGR00341 family protein [Desulfovibrio aminophilus]|nr:TIGR00341 family protein [Desulfovibrio aminophilus]MCM0753926.1 TIGR00341 family protein [Desulfovibrio aminophilus]